MPRAAVTTPLTLELSGDAGRPRTGCTTKLRVPVGLPWTGGETGRSDLACFDVDRGRPDELGRRRPGQASWLLREAGRGADGACTVGPALSQIRALRQERVY